MLSAPIGERRTPSSYGSSTWIRPRELCCLRAACCLLSHLLPFRVRPRAPRTNKPPKMSQDKKSGQWHSRMKAHIRVAGRLRPGAYSDRHGKRRRRRGAGRTVATRAGGERIFRYGTSAWTRVWQRNGALEIDNTTRPTCRIGTKTRAGGRGSNSTRESRPAAMPGASSRFGRSQLCQGAPPEVAREHGAITEDRCRTAVEIRECKALFPSRRCSAHRQVALSRLPISATGTALKSCLAEEYLIRITSTSTSHRKDHAHRFLPSTRIREGTCTFSRLGTVAARKTIGHWIPRARQLATIRDC